MQLLYSDSQLAVCVKPVGLDSEHQLPQLLQQELGGDIFPIHRLDLNVGGVMVYARTRTAAAALSRSIQEGSFVKEYLAQVHGQPPQWGDLQDLLWKDSRKNKVFVVRRQRSGVKDARLQYACLIDGPDSLVHIRLYTGRSHQIRVQFASRGYPLVGDHKYGARDSLTAPRLFSCRVQFPWRGKALCFEAIPDWAGLSALPAFPAEPTAD